MKFKTEVDLADEPPIPDKLRTKMVRIVRGAKKIAIQEQTGPKSFKQVNALFLKVDGPRDHPSDSLDAIVEAAAKIMHVRWLEKTAEQETADVLQFRIQAECVAGSGTRRGGRPHFLFKWDPDEDDVGTEDLDHFRDEILLELVDRLRAQGDRDAGHIEELHSTILEQARMNVEPIAAASRMGELGGQIMQQAFGLYQHLLETKYSEEAARAEQEGKTKRSEAMYTRLDRYFTFASKAVGDQVGAYIKKKMGGGNAATEEEEERAERATRKVNNEETDEDEENAEDLEHPLAALCEVFGSSLTPQQRKKMREDLSADLIGLFDELFCAANDDEVVELWLHIKDTADPTQLLKLFAMLDPVQTEYYQNVAKAVDQLQSEEAEEEAEEEDGDDTDA